MEPAVLLLGANDELVAADLHDRALQQLPPATCGHTWTSAGAHLNVIRPGDFDRLENADLVIARDGRSSAFAAVMAAGGGGGGSGDHGRGDGLAHGSSCDAVLYAQYSRVTALASAKRK